MSIKVSVKELCATCHSAGVLLIGFRAISELNPRHLLPGLCLLVAMLVSFAAMFVFRMLVFRVVTIPSQYVDWASVGVVLVTVNLVLSSVPLRMLVCPKCRRVYGVRCSRTVPLEWQERITPDWTCKTCGYMLIGIVGEARCPECGQSFPRSWLPMTETGDATATVEFEVT